MVPSVISVINSPRAQGTTTVLSNPHVAAANLLQLNPLCQRMRSVSTLHTMRYLLYGCRLS